MSFYSEADYQALKTAYLALAGGEKEIQVSINGKFVRYQDVQINHLRAALNSAAVELGHVPDRAFAKPIGRFD
jgi:hypothetical protein